MYIITGMHRSGTSLIARLFLEAGADMGDPDNFYPPDEWNPKGYFEQPDIHAINMPLINGPWGRLAYFWLPSNKKIMERAETRAEQIKRTADRYKNKVVKETRFCLTLPAWLEHGAQINGIMVCLRDPIQVVRSIKKRNFTFVRHALHLWYIHSSRLLDNAEGIPMWFVYYNNVLEEESYIREMKSAYQFFGFDFTDDELWMLREKCVRPQMNHNPEKRTSYPPKIQQLWIELLGRHAAQFEREVKGQRQA